MSASDSRPVRRSIRLAGFDYAQTGAYFVTVCAHQRLQLFGRIVDGTVALEAYGAAVRDEWLSAPEHRSDVELDAFVVMPNHFHAIVWIVRPDSGTARRAPTTERYGRPVAESLPTLVRAFKAAATKRVNELRQGPGAPLWQRGYYEHVIRSEADLLRIREYVVNNPLQWALDRENPDAQRREAAAPWMV